MSGHIHPLDLLKRRVRINLRRTERSMPQQLLYRPDIRSVVQHRRRKRVPQNVRRVFLERTHLAHTRAHDTI